MIEIWNFLEIFLYKILIIKANINYWALMKYKIVFWFIINNFKSIKKVKSIKATKHLVSAPKKEFKNLCREA